MISISGVNKMIKKAIKPSNIYCEAKPPTTYIKKRKKEISTFPVYDKLPPYLYPLPPVPTPKPVKKETPKPVKKETPNQARGRLKTEKIATLKKKITVLNKEIKMLKAENVILKAQLPVTVDPKTVKDKSDIIRRFSTMDFV